MLGREENLSYEISEIKKRNNYGLIEMSEHALERMQEREIKQDLILNCISKRNTTIIQHHMPNTYHCNRDELFVLYGKVILNDKHQPLHIVIAKVFNGDGIGFVYRVVTCYVPSKSLFYAHGRKLRR